MSEMMKAAVLYGNEDIRYTDWALPEPKAGEVRVKVKAAGICGSDVPRVLANGAHFYPVVLGHEFAGVIDKLGEGVTGLEIGDTVSGAPLKPCMTCPDCARGNYSLCKHYSFVGSREQGSFAQYVCLPAVNAVKYSPDVPFEQAAMFEPATVSLHGLACNGFRAGEFTAICGGGTIGMFAAQWAKIFGARKVVVFDVVQERLDLALRLGADAVFNPLEPDFMKKAIEYTGGEGYGAVYETAGQPVTIKMAFELAANKASVCCIGTPHTNVEFTPRMWENMNRKEFKLTGSWMSYSAPFPGMEWKLTAECFSDGRLKFDDSFIFKRYSLADCSEAFALYKDPKQVKGKVMFIVD